MTERLYYIDSYLASFDARVVEVSADGSRVYLDRTAFYPASGGQPFDLGEIAGAPVTGVIDEEDRIAHVVAAPVAPGEVQARIHWPRRFDHMQQHTGQHLLSAVLAEVLGIPTLSFHLGSDVSTIDVATVALDMQQLRKVETRANEVIWENRPVSVSFEEASAGLDLRKPSERQGTLRVVSIQGLDRSACGGTHVRYTGEIGYIAIRKLDKIRGNVRIEFLCGGRAAMQARADYDALSAVARVFSSPLEDVPALAGAQMEKLQESEKARRRLAAELAKARGRELYEDAAPDSGGVRRLCRRLAEGTFDEEIRILAQSFTAHPKSVFMAAIENPPSVLLAASKDAGIHAGEKLKALLAAEGGRGGGSAAMAQGSVPGSEALGRVWAALGGDGG